MARIDLTAKTPLIGMSMVFSAMVIAAVFGFVFTFSDINDPTVPTPVVAPSTPTDGTTR